jgi:hypothetical protein
MGAEGCINARKAVDSYVRAVEGAFLRCCAHGLFPRPTGAECCDCSDFMQRVPELPKAMKALYGPPGPLTKSLDHAMMLGDGFCQLGLSKVCYSYELRMLVRVILLLLRCTCR